MNENKPATRRTFRARQFPRELTRPASPPVDTAAALAKFLAKGGQVTTLAPVDPDTVPARKQSKSDADAEWYRRECCPSCDKKLGTCRCASRGAEW